MVISGHLRDYPLAELLVFLSSKHFSGRLTLRSRHQSVAFSLRDGRLSSAESSDLDLRLGQRLLDEFSLNHAELTRALEVQEQIANRAPLGSILVLLGLTEHAIVERAVREQILANLVRLLLTADGKFKFKPGTPDARGIRIDLPIEREVLRAIHRADEWTAVTSQQALLILRRDATAEELAPVILPTWPVIDAMLDGATSIDEIAANTGWTMDKTVDTVLRLTDHSIIRIRLSESDALRLPPVATLPNAPTRIAS